jgi:hypothetical protein
MDKQLFLDGTQIESLPLFSGTAMREPERKESKPVQRQVSLFACPICFDTGTVKNGKKLVRCWCQG